MKRVMRDVFPTPSAPNTTILCTCAMAQYERLLTWFRFYTLPNTTFADIQCVCVGDCRQISSVNWFSILLSVLKLLKTLFYMCKSWNWFIIFYSCLYFWFMHLRIVEF